MGEERYAMSPASTRHRGARGLTTTLLIMYVELIDLGVP